MKNWIKKVNSNVLWLSLGSFINDLSSEMMIPILPMFLNSLGAGSFVIGLVGGMRDGLANILKIVGGYYSNKLQKRKPFVFWGYFVSNIFKLLLSFSTTWFGALLFSTLERVGKGVRTAPQDTIISQSMPGAKGKAFAIHRAMDTAGAIGGSLVAFLLIYLFDFRFKIILILAAIISFFSLIPMQFIKEVTDKTVDFEMLDSSTKFSFKFKYFIFVSSLFAFANFSYMFFILKSQNFFIINMALGERLAFALPIALYVLYNIFYTSFAIPFGIVSDKIGRKKILMLGYFLFALVCIGFIFVKSIFGFIFLFAVYGLFCAAVNSNQRAMAADLAPKKSLSFALGAFHTTIGMMTFCGSIFAGLLAQYLNLDAAFVFGATTSFFAVILLAFLEI